MPDLVQRIIATVAPMAAGFIGWAFILRHASSRPSDEKRSFLENANIGILILTMGIFIPLLSLETMITNSLSNSVGLLSIGIGIVMLPLTIGLLVRKFLFPSLNIGTILAVSSYGGGNRGYFGLSIVILFMSISSGTNELPYTSTFLLVDQGNLIALVAFAIPIINMAISTSNAATPSSLSAPLRQLADHTRWIATIAGVVGALLRMFPQSLPHEAALRLLDATTPFRHSALSMLTTAYLLIGLSALDQSQKPRSNWIVFLGMISTRLLFLLASLTILFSIEKYSNRNLNFQGFILAPIPVVVTIFMLCPPSSIIPAFLEYRIPDSDSSQVKHITAIWTFAYIAIVIAIAIATFAF